MKLVQFLTLALGLSALAGAATAQSDVITVNLANSWVVLSNSSNSSQCVTQQIPGQGADTLSVNACSTTNLGPGNQTQSNVAGNRTGNIAMSGSAAASSFGFMTFSWNGPGVGTASATADTVAGGTLPPLSNINMSGSSQATITIGIFAGGPFVSSMSSSVVTAPQVFPGGLGAVNRLTKTQGAPVSQNVPALGYFYSCVGNASATASLKRGDNAFFNTNVKSSATLNLF
ncbi:MAG: hypothetical protein HOP15_07200 [Planctomycetes bacterium]|nr:hypothetical protein [Planctomycetota bacterium]